MIPAHYSRDIARRCQSLIHHLWPRVVAGLPDDARFGGPLQTTFLLAMATPMVILPFDRIFKPSTGAERVGDDTKLDEELANLVTDALGPEKTFGKAPFAATNCWNYVHGYPLFDIAGNWPRELLKKLATPEAAKNAEAAEAGRILCNLRNALAHGGVAYLNEDGRHSSGQAAMLAFAAFERKDNKNVGLNVLRVHEDDFRAFLGAWAKWLGTSGVESALNEAA